MPCNSSGEKHPDMQSLNTREWIQVEDTARLWDVEINGFPVWTLIRGRVMDSLFSEGMGASSGGDVSRWRRINPKLWSKYLKTLRFLASHQNDYSSIFFKPGLDWFQKYYYSRVKNPLIAESLWRGITSEEEWRSSDTFILTDPLMIYAALQARRITLPNPAEKQLSELIATLINAFKLPESRRESLETHLRKSLKSALVLPPLLEKHIFPRISGKFAILHQACYLGGEAILTRALHDAGFTVAEPQHGMISQSDYPYQYPESFVNNPDHPAHRCFPDYLLVFGEYWRTQINIPSKTVITGFPQLSEKAAHMDSRKIDVRQILIVSQFTVSAQMVELAETVARAYPQHRIIFKLHPNEIEMPERFTSLHAFRNVSIRGLENIHDLIAHSAIIIGMYSTTLFEAQVFPGKRVFYLENLFFTCKLGASFTTPDELIALIADPDRGQAEYPYDYFFAPDWESRIDAFLREHVEMR